MQRLLLLVFFLFFMKTSWSQDFIVKADSSSIDVKVVEVSEFEIKYFEWHNLSGPLFTIEVDEIAYIRFSDGKVIRFKGHVSLLNTDIDAAAINKKNILKVAPFSPLRGHLDFEFERVFGERMSFHTELGLIGINASKDVLTNAIGASLSGGVRIYKGQEIRQAKTFYNNRFTGFYVQARLGFEFYNYDYKDHVFDGVTSYDRMINLNARGGSFTLGFGRQWVFNGKWCLDLGGALGYEKTNEFSIEHISPWNHKPYTTVTENSLHHTGVYGDVFGLTADGWIKIGFVFR